MKSICLRKNLYFLIPIIILLIISLLNMYGASFTSNLYSKNLIKQGLWIIIGFLIMFVIYKIDINFIMRYSPYLYILGNIALLLVLFLGSIVNGARSWFKIGPFSMQPSELFKFFYLLFHLLLMLLLYLLESLLLFLYSILHFL